MKEHSNAKWLLRKSSGSKSKYKVKGRYADDKEQITDMYEVLPSREAIKKSSSYLDTSLVKRWLYSKVGCDFDDVYSEFISRIQPKYLHKYRECIFSYVHRKEFIRIMENGEVWGRAREAEPVRLPFFKDERFYIDPVTNQLMKIPEAQLKK